MTRKCLKVLTIFFFTRVLATFIYIYVRTYVYTTVVLHTLYDLYVTINNE